MFNDIITLEGYRHLASEANVDHNKPTMGSYTIQLSEKEGWVESLQLAEQILRGICPKVVFVSPYVRARSSLYPYVMLTGRIPIIIPALAESSILQETGEATTQEARTPLVEDFWRADINYRHAIPGVKAEPGESWIMFLQRIQSGMLQMVETIQNVPVPFFEDLYTQQEEREDIIFKTFKDISVPAFVNAGIQRLREQYGPNLLAEHRSHQAPSGQTHVLFCSHEQWLQGMIMQIEGGVNPWYMEGKREFNWRREHQQIPNGEKIVVRWNEGYGFTIVDKSCIRPRPPKKKN
jgi:broad specificity phosphatase PhoE